ncbi:hypothetical protein P7K49_036496, partial [Saguinus oedipus]
MPVGEGTACGGTEMRGWERRRDGPAKKRKEAAERKLSATAKQSERARGEETDPAVNGKKEAENGRESLGPLASGEGTPVRGESRGGRIPLSSSWPPALGSPSARSLRSVHAAPGDARGGGGWRGCPGTYTSQTARPRSSRRHQDPGGAVCLPLVCVLRGKDASITLCVDVAFKLLIPPLPLRGKS